MRAPHTAKATQDTEKKQVSIGDFHWPHSRNFIND